MGKTWSNSKIFCILIYYSFENTYFSDISILLGKILKNIHIKYSRKDESQFDIKLCLRSKSWREQTPSIFEKFGVCFHQLFDPSTPKASKRDPTAHEYFTRNIFMILAP